MASGSESADGKVPLDPWAEAEEAVRGGGAAPASGASPNKGPAAAASPAAAPAPDAEVEPEAEGEPTQPTAPAAPAAAPDPWAEAELAVGTAAAAAPASPEPPLPGDELASEAAEGALPEPGELPGEPVTGTTLVPFGSDEALDARVRCVGALLFASPEPLGDGRLAELLDDVSREQVRAAVGQLQARFEAAGLPFQARAVAGGWRLFTEAALGSVVGRLAKARRAERISQAGLETLSIIAYRQPVTKAEIEAIRGVQAGPLLRTLVDRGLVRVAGRADQPGAPLLYGTTTEFLDRFGLQSLKELPRDAELARD
jgi:segregation and condensation protein B